MSTNKNSIHILRGTKPSVNSTTLYDGQLYFDRGTKTLQVGDKSNSTIGNNNNYVTVKDGAINDAKVASDAAIKGSKLADASNDESNRTGITTAKIESNAITTEKIADDAITGNKISETASVYIQQLRVIKPDESTNPYDGLVRAERGVTCGTWLVAGNNYIQSKYMPEYIYYHNVNNREGKLLFPKRTLDSNGEIIATLNNIPKFQSINGNLYITT
jgi:hypothetical protein|nr:MAG TPA: major tropism determinant [Caudoviricetes sp.]